MTMWPEKPLKQASASDPRTYKNTFPVHREGVFYAVYRFSPLVRTVSANQSKLSLGVRFPVV